MVATRVLGNRRKDWIWMPQRKTTVTDRPEPLLTQETLLWYKSAEWLRGLKAVVNEDGVSRVLLCFMCTITSTAASGTHLILLFPNSLSNYSASFSSAETSSV